MLLANRLAEHSRLDAADDGHSRSRHVNHLYRTRFAIDRPKRTAVLLRSSPGVTARAHPLNKGVAEDFDEACEHGLLRDEARGSGVLYWLGLCQVLMANLLERPRAPADIARRIDEMVMLGLTGLHIHRSFPGPHTIKLLNEFIQPFLFYGRSQFPH